MSTASIAPAEANGLEVLLDEVQRVRTEIVAGAERRLAPFRAQFPGGQPTPSAVNLARYLALREKDRRSLQDRLAAAGLSSLGRSEGHVLSTIDRLIHLLCRAVGRPCPEPPPDAGPDLEAGARLLAGHADALFGPVPAEYPVPVMVTLPTDAARDPSLAHALVRAGVTCLRINCARDNAVIWRAMIDNVRRAQAETGRAARVLMDLAGHKLRTGPLTAVPTALHLRVQKDSLGRNVGPAHAVVYDQGGEADASSPLGQLPVPPAVAAQLQTGDRLHLTDTRGRRRILEVAERVGPGRWRVQCSHGAYVPPGGAFEWRRPAGPSQWRPLGRYHFGALPGVPERIRLVAGDPVLLTAGSQPGQAARRDAHGTVAAPARIGCTVPEAVRALRAGERVWIDDGKLGARVEAVSEAGALLRVTDAPPKGVRLWADRGINLPDTALHLPPLSARDLADLDFICAHADLVGFSFVETLEDMDALLRELHARGAGHLPVVAKIETRAAVKALPELLLGTIGRTSVGVMIARGDLAVELGGERLAEIQEEMLWLCEAAHVPVIWATGVLENLTKKGVISRPELTDAAMSGRADCVMLNKGPYVLRAVATLGDILRRMQDHQHKKSARLRALHW